MNIVGERDQKEMRRQFLELRNSIEKVRGAYHRHSQELKGTMGRMNTLADGTTRRTLEAKTHSLPSLSCRSVESAGP